LEGDFSFQSGIDAIDELFRQKIHGVRRMGTAALDIVQVGLGRFGGYFEYQLSPWDFAAARLFLEEAGGKITTCDGDKLPLEKTSVLATNSLLHDSMLEIVRKHANFG
jgi:myo-inositol-1(or 4)-monophosphatase